MLFQDPLGDAFSLIEVVLFRVQNEKLSDGVWRESPGKLKVDWLDKTCYRVSLSCLSII